ncbi:MAG: ABC transporter substrate-binding protein, partial [Acidobacteriota bacterium]
MKMRLSIVMAAALVLTACGGGEKKGGGSASASKDTLVIEVQSSPTNLDVRVGNDNVSGRMHELIYSGLVKVTPEMDYAPDVAEKWETPDDKTIIFHLNPAAKFQNGQPVKASDVKWTYDSLI